MYRSLTSMRKLLCFIVFITVSCSWAQSDFAGFNHISESTAKKAIKYYQKQISKGRTNDLKATQYYLGCSYYLQAISDQKKRQEWIDSAISEFKNCMTDKRFEFQSQFRTGLCYAYMDEYDEALPYFKKCVSAYPTHTWSNYYLGISLAYSLSPQPEDVTTVINELNWLLEYKTDPQARIRLGEALLSIGNLVQNGSIVYPNTQKLICDELSCEASIFPIEFHGGLIDVDSSNFVVQNKGISELSKYLIVLNNEFQPVDTVDLLNISENWLRDYIKHNHSLDLESANTSATIVKRSYEESNRALKITISEREGPQLRGGKISEKGMKFLRTLPYGGDLTFTNMMAKQQDQSFTKLSGYIAILPEKLR